jgi:hypothetical protein
MRIREAIAPLAAVTVLAGCGSHHEAVAEKTTPQTLPSATVPKQPVGPVLNAEKALTDELDTYRNKVIKGHKAAEILFGACVAWSNDSGITVTLNPGIGEAYMDGKDRDFLIFSTHDPNYKPDWGPLNGPDVGSNQVMTLIFYPKVIPKGSIHNRHLSNREDKGKHGQRFYRDAQTGAPVMDTVLANGPLTEAHVSHICNILREDEPTAAVLEKT